MYIESCRHGGTLVGLAPQTKHQAPHWNLKFYKSMKFLSNFNVKPPCTNVKPPYWRLSGGGSVYIPTVWRMIALNGWWVNFDTRSKLLKCRWYFHSLSQKQNKRFLNTSALQCSIILQCCSHSAGVALDGMCANGMSAKNNTHVYVARTSNNRAIVACKLCRC